MDRRNFLRLTSGATAAAALRPTFAFARESDFTHRFRQSAVRAVPLEASATSAGVQVLRAWHGDVCSIRIVNRRQQAVRLREIVVAELEHGFPAETGLYGESFQMLSQTGGTIGKPLPLGYDELQHYKIPQPEG